jgi:hypothetical protein
LAQVKALLQRQDKPAKANTIKYKTDQTMVDNQRAEELVLAQCQAPIINQTFAKEEIITCHQKIPLKFCVLMVCCIEVSLP